MLDGGWRQGLQERRHHSLGPPGAAFEDLLDRPLGGESRLTGAGDRERVVHVKDPDHLGGEGDLVPHEPVGIAAAVVVLVVPADDRLQVPGKLNVREELDARQMVDDGTLPRLATRGRESITAVEERLRREVEPDFSPDRVIVNDGPASLQAQIVHATDALFKNLRRHDRRSNRKHDASVERLD